MLSMQAVNLGQLIDNHLYLLENSNTHMKERDREEEETIVFENKSF